MDNIFNLATLFALTFLLSLLLIPICRNVALRLGILDQPDSRKIHKEPIPYFGGVAIYAALMLGLVLINFLFHWINTELLVVLAVSSSFIFLLGLIDDVAGSRAWLKFAVQIAVAIFIVRNGISLSVVTNPFGGGTINLGFAGPIISVLWIVAITNAVNLLDGLDGLAGGVSATAIMFMIGFALYGGDLRIAGILLSLLGGILGFLFYNFPPAKIFMGDAGSLTIGFLFSVVCLMANTKGPYTITVLIPAMLLAIPILDTAWAVFRRTKNKQSIFQADKEHLHHRILALSKSYRKTLLTIYAINFFLGVIAMVTFLIPNEYRIILIFVLAQDILFGVYILNLLEKAKSARDGRSSSE